MTTSNNSVLISVNAFCNLYFCSLTGSKDINFLIIETNTELKQIFFDEAVLFYQEVNGFTLSEYLNDMELVTNLKMDSVYLKQVNYHYPLLKLYLDKQPITAIIQEDNFIQLAVD